MKLISKLTIAALCAALVVPSFAAPAKTKKPAKTAVHKTVKGKTPKGKASKGKMGKGGKKGGKMSMGGKKKK